MQSAWISVQDRMPPDDTPVLVYVPGNEMLAFAIDQWQMQREAPLGWSSATIETGMGWCDHDYEDVSHWMPLTAPEPPPSEVFSRVHKQLLDAATLAAQDGDVVELPQAALGPAARGLDADTENVTLLRKIDRVIEHLAISRLLGHLGWTAAGQDVLAERRRQVEKGYTAEHDDEHVNDELAALACYCLMPPWARAWSAESAGYGDTFGEAMIPAGWHEPSAPDRRTELVIGVALGLAEIERLDRAAAREGGAA